MSRDRHREEEALLAAVLRLRDRFGCFEFQTGFADVIAIVAQIQLALRHPRNTGPCAQDARRIVENIIGALEKEEPELGPILRLGFDPEEDT